MGTILQDMMGMLSRKKVATPKTDDYITVARYTSAQEILKPFPKVETELVTMGAIKTFVNAGSSDSQQLSIDGQILSLTNGGSVTIPSAPALPYTSSFIFISQSGTENPTAAFLSNDAELVLASDARLGVGEYRFEFASGPAEDAVMVVLPGGVRTGEWDVVSLFSAYTVSGGTGTLLIESYGITNADLLQPADIGFGGDNSIIVEIKVFR